MTTRGAVAALLAPFAIAAAGAGWMRLAIDHFESVTGRGLKRLVGYMYSVPDYGFTYLPGGQEAERWAFSIPLGATAAALLISAVATSMRIRRDAGWPVMIVVALLHVGALALFAIVFAAYWLEAVDAFI